MSVRKSYQLLLDGEQIASGSYATVVSCFNSVRAALEFLDVFEFHSLVVAFSLA